MYKFWILWILIAMQIIAFIFYYVGSRKFYKFRSGFMKWLAVGIILDIMMAIIPNVFELPKMSDHGAPWSSILFVTHIFAASTGMLGFIIMFVYLGCLYIRGKYKYHNFYWYILISIDISTHVHLYHHFLKNFINNTD